MLSHVDLVFPSPGAVAGLQVPLPHPCLNQEHLVISLFYSLAFGTDRVWALQWIIQALALPCLRLWDPGFLQQSPGCGCGRGEGCRGPPNPHTYLMVTSACSPYSFCSRAFRKDISVCSGASWAGGESQDLADVYLPSQCRTFRVGRLQ